MRSPTMAAHETLAGSGNATNGLGVSGAQTSAPSSAPIAAQVQAYQDLISGPLAEYVSKSEALGGVVADHVSYPTRD